MSKKKKATHLKASFLDLDINAKIASFRLSYVMEKMLLFSLPFSTIRIPYGDSNMSTRNFYATVGSEILQSWEMGLPGAIQKFKIFYSK